MNVTTLLEQWFTVMESAPGLTRITEPKVHPMLQSNCWWLRGNERDVVIDAGLGIVALRDEIPELFERDPLLIVTHAHLDHVGGAYEFDEVSIHESEAAYLRNPAPSSLDTVTLYESLGIDIPQKEDPSMLNSLPYPGYRPDDYSVTPVEPTHLLRDTQILEVGGWQLKVIAAPGHTPGSICLLEQSNGWLFTGDVVYEGRILDEIKGADRRHYRHTMRNLQSLKITTVYPGHGEPFGPEKLQQITAEYLARPF
jgi:glyoxylase-like metal-dependent hydrolase (beta-lactamase superfamily II)